MKLFLDSSAFAKRFVEEKGSQQVQDLCSQATELCLCVLCVLEVVSALNRRLREKNLTRLQYQQAKQSLAQEVNDAIVIDLTPEVVRLGIEVLEASPVQTMDALQIASALAWQADLFASADHRQTTAAKAAKLHTRQI